MSHFYGKISQSARNVAPTACGDKSSGITTVAASWDGCIEVRLWHNEKTGEDMFEVTQNHWRGNGVHEEIASGTLGKIEGTWKEGHEPELGPVS